MIRYLEDKIIVWKKSDNVRNALPNVDYVFFNDEELEFVSGKGIIEDGVHCLQDKYGAKNVIITQGSKGSQLFLEGKNYHIRAFTPRVKSPTTGAGDSYMAGFLKAQELYDDPIKQGEFAAMTATMVIEEREAFDKTVEDVLESLKIIFLVLKK